MGESASDGAVLTAAADTWARGLRNVTGNQIAEGLRRCLEREDPWPPTLPEFVRLCLHKPHREPAHVEFPPALPKPPVDPELKRSEIAKMREALG